MTLIKWLNRSEEKKKEEKSGIHKYPADARVEPNEDVDKLIQSILLGKPKHKSIRRFY